MCFLFMLRLELKPQYIHAVRAGAVVSGFVRVANCLIPYLDYRSDWLYQHPFG